MAPSLDRLSTLPDEILSHILSFLPTKISISTCILAKRWRFVWAYVPNLRFNEYYYHNPRTAGCYFYTINRIMSAYKLQSMNTFSLTNHSDNCQNHNHMINSCIAAAIAHNVKNLDIFVCYKKMLPFSIFTCKTLVDLRLGHCNHIPISGSAYLPALKKLHLDLVQYESDQSLPNLLSGCPVLEDLTVDRLVMRDSNMFCCYVTSPTVKRLTLNSKFSIVGVTQVRDYRVKINTPELMYLKVHDSVSHDVSAEEVLTSLTEADIVLDCCWLVDGYLHSRSVFSFVCKMRNVKYLKLSSCYALDPNSRFDALNIKFRNLTKLELEADWEFLSNFLENADNLEVLIVHKVYIVKKCWMEQRQVPRCLLLKLKSIQIHRFGCTENEYDMIKYLLGNAKVLETMKIYSPGHGTDLTLKRISSLKRGSEACDLTFNGVYGPINIL